MGYYLSELKLCQKKFLAPSKPKLVSAVSLTINDINNYCVHVADPFDLKRDSKVPKDSPSWVKS